MNEKEINNRLNALDKIQAVDAPEFLLTRILQKIEQVASDKISHRTAWIVSISFAIILIINIAMIAGTSSNASAEPNLAESMNLLPNNQLYK